VWRGFAFGGLLGVCFTARSWLRSGAWVAGSHGDGEEAAELAWVLLGAEEAREDLDGDKLELVDRCGEVGE
jgi:hypothetical protein